MVRPKGIRTGRPNVRKRSTVEVKKAKDQLKAYEQKEIERILEGARFFPELLHIMMVIGEPGWGKSRLALTLAAVLKNPLYQMNLSDDNIQTTDFNALCTIQIPMVLQFDEWQDTSSKWAAGESSAGGVSLSTFCDALQGNATILKGICIITASAAAEEHLLQPSFTALRERIIRFRVKEPSMENIHLVCRTFLATRMHDKFTSDEVERVCELLTANVSSKKPASSLSYRVLIFRGGSHLHSHFRCCRCHRTAVNSFSAASTHALRLSLSHVAAQID